MLMSTPTYKIIIILISCVFAIFSVYYEIKSDSNKVNFNLRIKYLLLLVILVLPMPFAIGILFFYSAISFWVSLGLVTSILISQIFAFILIYRKYNHGFWDGLYTSVANFGTSFSWSLIFVAIVISLLPISKSEHQEKTFDISQISNNIEEIKVNIENFEKSIDEETSDILRLGDLLLEQIEKKKMELENMTS